MYTLEGSYSTCRVRVHLDTAYFSENWKHCNKIIFKYVNSVVWPIFNESFVKKKKFVGPVNSARDPLTVPFQWKIWTFKEVVGPVHSAQDPLTDTFPHEMHFSINK